METASKEISKIDNIKFLFSQIKTENKNDLYEKVALEFGVTTSTVRTGWFVRFEVTNRYNLQTNLIKYLQNYIANQTEE